METSQFELLSKHLARIADALERMAGESKPSAPDIVRPIADYSSFDWASVNAEVVQSDKDGPTHVSHLGRLFTRRSPVNKFEPAIWFSSPAGKDEKGEVIYLRLITFRKMSEAEELPGKLAQTLNNGKHPEPQPPVQTGQSQPPLVTADEYRKVAFGLALSPEAAAVILKEADGAPATAITWLTFFVEAKKRGVKFNDAISTFRLAGRDIEFAVKALPKQI